MNLTYPSGAWPVYIEIDHVKNLTDQDIQTIGRLIAEKTVVVFKKHTNLTQQEHIDFSERFGELRYFKWHTKKMDKAICPDHPNVCNITGKLNDDNLPGLHGGSADLDWHINMPHISRNTPILCLYGAEGTKGSRTSYLNSIDAWNDLSTERKARLDQYHIRPTLDTNSYSTVNKAFGVIGQELTNYQPSVHQKNRAGYDTLYFPWNQMVGLCEINDTAEYEEIRTGLMKHMLQEKYMYHHDWDDGDIVIADQLSGMHKRWAFELMHERLLRRTDFNYMKIVF